MTENHTIEEPKILRDWRGEEIKVGTRILHRGHIDGPLLGGTHTGIGIVAAIHAAQGYSEPLLSVFWEENSAHKNANWVGVDFNPNVQPFSVTVWPNQPVGPGLRDMLMRVMV